MVSISEGVVATILVALIGVIIPAITIVINRRNTQADRRETEANIAEKWQGMLRNEQKENQRIRERMDEFEVRLDKAEREIGRLIEGISVLSNQLVEAGLEPDWRYNGDG